MARSRQARSDEMQLSEQKRRWTGARLQVQRASGSKDIFEETVKQARQSVEAADPSNRTAKEGRACTEVGERPLPLLEP